MNVLFFAHRLPYPPNKGGKIRSFQLLRHLAKRHTVHLETFVDDPTDFEHVASVGKLSEGRLKIISLPGSTAKLKVAAALAVALVHKASGVQTKVLETMAIRKVVIATTPVARALDITAGRQLLVADTVPAFAGPNREVYPSNGRPEVARAAQWRVDEHYGWDNNLAIVDRLLQATRDASQSTPHPAPPLSRMRA